MDLAQTLLGAAIVFAILYVLGRSQRSSAGGVVPSPSAGARPGTRSSGLQPLTRLEDVVPVPAPAGWATLPDEPPGLDGELEDRPRVDVADRPYDRATCPTCEAQLDPLPKAKKRCPSCGQDIYVRSGPDDRRYLLASSELEAFQLRWSEAATARWTEAQNRQEAALAEWHDRLAAAGFAVGNRDLDVVGESYYHAALAGIRAALHQGGGAFEVRAAGLLQREPDNPYDKNAIGVYVHGAKVGHLDRYDAEEYQPLLKSRGGQMWSQAVLLGGRMTPVGEVGPIGVLLDDIPGPHR